MHRYLIISLLGLFFLAQALKVQSQTENYFELGYTIVNTNFRNYNQSPSKSVAPLEYLNNLFLRYTMSDLSVRAIVQIDKVVCNSQTRLSNFAMAPAYKNDSSIYTGGKCGLGLQYRANDDAVQVYGLADVVYGFGTSTGALQDLFVNQNRYYVSKHASLGLNIGVGTRLRFQNSLAIGAEVSRCYVYSKAETKFASQGSTTPAAVQSVTATTTTFNTYGIRLFVIYVLNQ